MSNRGRALQPDRECDYCNKPLPELRHPNAKYCDPICRGRDRWSREHIGNGVKCLDCGKLFVRVGSHVVQSHSYESVLEYKQEHGLMGKETHTEEHTKLMRSKVTKKALDNLTKGKPMRYEKGDDHSEKLKAFWSNRKSKKGYIQTNTSLGNR